MHLVRKKKNKRTVKSELKAPLKLNSDYFFSTCIHEKNKETFCKLPTSYTATKPFPVQSCHGFCVILSSYCQNSNSSHHFLSCLPSILQMFARQKIFFKFLCESSWVQYTTTRNIISFGKVIDSLISSLKADHASIYL